MAYTQEQLDELEKAIALGVTSTKHGDKQTTYRSLEDMKKLRDIIRRELGLPGADLVHRKGVVDKGLA